VVTRDQSIRAALPQLVAALGRAARRHGLVEQLREPLAAARAALAAVRGVDGSGAGSLGSGDAFGFVERFDDDLTPEPEPAAAVVRQHK